MSVCGRQQEEAGGQTVVMGGGGWRNRRGWWTEDETGKPEIEAHDQPQRLGGQLYRELLARLQFLIRHDLLA